MQLRRLSFTIGHTGPAESKPLPEASVPAAQASTWPQRRLADAIDAAFRLALSRGDLITAEELLEVRRGLRNRVRIRTPSDRRRGDPQFERAQRELEARKQARYRRY